MDRRYYLVSIKKNIENGNILFVPFGVNERGLSQALHKYFLAESSIDDKTLGEISLKYLEISKNFSKDDLTLESEEYLRGVKEQKINKYYANSIHVDISYLLKDKQYEIIKNYKVSRNGYQNNQSDPKHILPFNSTPEEIGRTIRLAFDDISADGKER